MRSSRLEGLRIDSEYCSPPSDVGVEGSLKTGFKTPIGMPIQLKC
jgi:hypothetical protein